LIVRAKFKLSIIVCIIKGGGIVGIWQRKSLRINVKK